MKAFYYLIKRCALAAAFACVACVAGGVSAAPVLQMEDGVLVGVEGVLLGGKAYSVDFLAGTCAEAYGECVTSKFAFSTLIDAQDASRALRDQVFHRSYEGPIDPRFNELRGCNTGHFCFVATPYDVSDNLVQLAWVRNELTGTGLGSDLEYPIDMDHVNVSFARWELSPAQIPEPGSLALFSLAAAVLGLARRKQSR